MVRLKARYRAACRECARLNEGGRWVLAVPPFARETAHISGSEEGWGRFT